MRLTLFSVFLFLGISTGTVAQTSEIRFNNYSIEEGLSQSTVYAILQDQLGYIWIGTRDGLNRFDQSTFLKFYPSQAGDGALSYRSIRALVSDEKGDIWIGTDGGGVDRLDPQENSFRNLCSFLNTANCPVKTNVTSLEVTDSLLYIGTRNEGAFVFNMIENSLERLSNGNSTIWDMYSIGEELWIATSSGIKLLTEEGERSFLESDEIRAIERISGGRLLFGSRDGGIYVLKRGTYEVTLFSEALKEIEISSLTEYDEQSIWVGTDQNGVYILSSDGELIHNLHSGNQSEHRLTTTSIRTIYKDKNGMMWVGTNNGGVANYYRGRYQFKDYTQENTQGLLNARVILSFNELDSGKMLVGTEQQGLFQFDPQTNLFEAVQVFSNSSIIALLKDASGKIWVATDGEGLLVLGDQENLNARRFVNGLTNESVLSLHESPTGLILAGTYKGLNVIDGYSPVNLDYAPVYLQEDRVLAIGSISDHEFLLGTFSNGLIYYNMREQTFTRYLDQEEGDSDAIIPERVQSIYQDSEGVYWLGTYSGLSKFDTASGTFETYTTVDGLPSDVVYGILEDEEGSLWLSTNYGISEFNAHSESFTNFSLQDGLSSMEFNGGAYFAASTGEMYFGGVDGFVSFLPSQLEDTKGRGNIIIHSLNVDGVEYNALNTRDFSLKSGQDYLEVGYSYLNFINPEKYSIEYRINGLSERWVPVKSGSSLNFSGLAPGDYALEMRALDQKNQVAARSQAINLSILPPLWRRWYVILLGIGILSIAITALFRYRMFYLLKEEETRNRIARDLHDDISATLSSISFFSEAARRKQQEPEEGNEYLGLIEKSAVEAKEKINDIIWSIDPEYDDPIGLLTKCKRFAGDMFESKGISYRLDFQEEVLIPAKPEIRKDFWLIYKELINNLVRHSGAATANVLLKKEGNVLILKVQDDGKGIREEEKIKGNGIRNLQFRAGRLKGEIVHKQPEEGGTIWELMIPV